MSRDLDDADWDLSWLLQEPDAPAGGAAAARRTVRRRRTARAATAVAAAVVAVTAVVSAVGLSSGRTATRVTVGPAVGAATPLVAGRPAAAPAGSSPFDWGSLRVWLPAGWSPQAGGACGGPGDPSTVGLPAADAQQLVALTPCHPPTGPVPQLILAGAVGSPPSGVAARSTRINGLAVESWTAPGGTVTVHIPSLHASVVADGAAATAILASLQPSAPWTLATRSVAQAPPAAWRDVVYDGLAFAVPQTWPVDDPSNPCNPPEPSLQLGLATSSPGCPFAGGGTVAPYPLDDLVRVVPDVWAASTEYQVVRTYRIGALTASAAISTARPPAVVLRITGAAQPLTMTVDVGADTTVAQAVLGSVHAAPGQADSIVSCTVAGQPGMPAPTRLAAAETLDAGLVRLDPPAPTDQPTVPAAQAWSQLSAQGNIAGSTAYQLLLARLTYPDGPHPPGSMLAEDRVLVWVVLGRYTPPAGSIGCQARWTLSEVSATSTSAESFGGSYVAGPVPAG